MPTTVSGLQLRRVLGRRDWSVPIRFGPDGWRLDSVDQTARVIVSADEFDGQEWIHASMSRADQVPTYEDLVLLHKAAFGDGWAYQVFAPAEHHINIHAYVLHLWGRADGKPTMPNFGEMGTI